MTQGDGLRLASAKDYLFLMHGANEIIRKVHFWDEMLSTDRLHAKE